VWRKVVEVLLVIMGIKSGFNGYAEGVICEQGSISKWSQGGVCKEVPMKISILD
jgi:hypothetical protein